MVMSQCYSISVKIEIKRMYKKQIQFNKDRKFHLKKIYVTLKQQLLSDKIRCINEKSF